MTKPTPKPNSLTLVDPPSGFSVTPRDGGFVFTPEPPKKPEAREAAGSLEVGDMVRFDGARATLVITAIVPSRPKSPFDGTDLATGKRFRFGPRECPVKFGHMDDLSGIANLEKAAVDHKNQRRADDGLEWAKYKLEMAKPESLEAKKWAYLLSLKAGDPMPITVRGERKTYTFGLLLASDKWCFVAARPDGKRFKLSLANIILPEVK